MKALNCAVVRDLLPLYTEKLTCPETARLVEEHLEECGPCRAMRADYEKEIPIPIEKPTDKDRKLVRGRRFQLIWYLFWPLLFAASKLFSMGWVTGFMVIMLIAVFWVTNSHTALYIYDLDDTKKEFYEREKRNIDAGKGSFFKQGIVWALPILLPLLLDLIPWLIRYIQSGGRA